MSDRFHTIAFDKLVDWIFSELEIENSILGLPRALFFDPQPTDPFTLELYGQHLNTPFGAAAGPHTQMAQNIVLAWLCGARVIELKTVQDLDCLDITKPCIDMQDEGYNVEWSQELTIDESIDEYARAWVLIHALHRVLGHPGSGPDAMFNMSVGYDLKGVQGAKVRRFVETMLDAGSLVDRHLQTIVNRRPDVRGLEIPRQISNSVTLSTMHGCPPDEIGRISSFLMSEWQLHTSVKLNPTLLGPKDLRSILNDQLGYANVTVPDQAFEHDIGFGDAVDLLRDLGQQAADHGLIFGTKLTNTLEVLHDGSIFDAGEKQMYLSGRPLHALSVNVAHRLSEAFDGRLLMSFAGGADAFNAPDLLAAGMRTVTTCSDLLRPGGYSRLLQYLETTRTAMAAVDATNLDAFAIATAGSGGDARSSARTNLARYATKVSSSPHLQRDAFDRTNTKTDRKLGIFDCTQAPCTDACFVDQAVPRYMRAVEGNDLAAAIAITREDNPLAAVLGRACTHPCENVCLRTHYDEPLAIREIKRFIMDHEDEVPAVNGKLDHEVRVAIIGGGPCGLSAATFLARAGYRVTIFESRPYSGGMVAGTIPVYRTSHDIMNQDLRAVEALGIEVRHDSPVGPDLGLSDLRSQGFAHIIVAAGAQEGWRLGIDGEDGPGVLDGLRFLRAAKHGSVPPLGSRIVVIGGGDVAMDCARTARRLSGAEVSVLYRRTRAEMPAQNEEIEDLLIEGIDLVELVTPVRIERKTEGLGTVVCSRMELGEPDDSGRRRPLPIPDADFELGIDTLILAIGQKPRLEFLTADGVELTRSGHVKVDPATLETTVKGVYAGGDAISGAALSIVRACGDGRRIAATIRLCEEGWVATTALPPPAERTDLLRRRAERQWRVTIPHLAAAERAGFDEVVLALDSETAATEARRCLDCDIMCSTCESVCPNHAIFTYRAHPQDLPFGNLRVKDGSLEQRSGPPFRIEQELQVAVLTDFCNECGNCVNFCPTAGRPFRDKPRLYLHRPDFEAESDNAFMLFADKERLALEARVDGALHRIELGIHMRYRSPEVEVVFDRETLEIIETSMEADVEEGREISLDHCASMWVLLDALHTSMPGLPFA